MASKIQTSIDLDLTSFLTNIKKSSDASKAAAAEIRAEFTKALAGMGMKFDTSEMNKAVSEFNKLQTKATTAGKEAGTKLGSEIAKETEKHIKKIDFKSIGNTMLGVLGGNIISKGLSGLTSGFEELFKAGEKSLQLSEQLELSFKQAGLSGEGLEKQLASTGTFASRLSNEFAVSAGKVREYAGEAAFLGGATGQQNEGMTTLAIGIEKATRGMIDGTQVIRAFSKGLNDPEAQASLGRLTARFPQLATALKGVQSPAEMTQNCLS